jgi:hypothetical protein
MEVLRYSGGRFHCLLSTGTGIALLSVAVVGAARGEVFWALVIGGLSLVSLHTTVTNCHRVELSGSELVLHYVLRRRVVHASAIREIRFISDGESRDEFRVRYVGGWCELGSDRDSRAIMSALVRLNPAIEREAW